MEKYAVKQDRHTPEVLLDAQEMIFKITGSSLPEDVEKFYQPIIDWLDKFVESMNNISKPLNIFVKFNYYNSGSMRYIAEFFKRIKRISDKNIETTVNWYYDEDDDLLYEAGQDLAEVTGLEFKFIAE